MARVTRAGAILGAVRSATGGTDPGLAAVAPFAGGSWLFSHNGVITGWPDSAAALAATLDAGVLLGLAARVDSALLWVLVLDRLRRGQGPAEALADTIAALDAAGVTGRFNFLLTDGQVIAATAAGDTLWYRAGPRGGRRVRAGRRRARLDPGTARQRRHGDAAAGQRDETEPERRLRLGLTRNG